MNDEYDFYAIGMKAAERYWEDSKKAAKEIEESYGKDARMEYECGLSIVLGKASINSIEESFSSLKKISGHKIEVEEELRNNSYFGTAGVSKKVDQNGNYSEPSNYRRK